MPLLFLGLEVLAVFLVGFAAWGNISWNRLAGVAYIFHFIAMTAIYLGQNDDRVVAIVGFTCLFVAIHGLAALQK